jgi:Flp pilus assembly protein TadG
VRGFRRPFVVVLRQARLALGVFRRDSTGSALVETTIMMPFLLILCAGVFSFGDLFYKRLLVETGVRDASRYLARCSTTIWSTSDCEDKARNIAVFGDPDDTSTPRVTDWGVGEVAVSYAEITNDDGSGNKLYRGGEPCTADPDEVCIKIVQVGTTFPYTGTGLLQFIGFASIDINATHEERFVGW